MARHSHPFARCGLRGGNQSLRTSSTNGSNLFQLCTKRKWSEVRKYLSSDAAEEEKSNIMCRDDYGETCLHAAVYFDAPDDIIKTMLDIGGKELVMEKANSDETVLHYAFMNGKSYNIIKMLIEVGGKDLIMAKNTDGDNPLHSLCWHIEEHDDADDKIKLILQVGDTNLLLSITGDEGQTPLEIATDKFASNDVIKKLLTEHEEEGEGTVVQSQTQSSKRRRVGNTRSASSGSLNTNQAEDDDAAMIAGQLDQYNMLMSRYMATRRELRMAKARNAELKQEIDDLAI
eukprot:scaffold2255_cov293-Chaetoceros_neogracile.AAC.9